MGASQPLILEAVPEQAQSEAPDRWTAVRVDDLVTYMTASGFVFWQGKPPFGTGHGWQNPVCPRANELVKLKET